MGTLDTIGVIVATVVGIACVLGLVYTVFDLIKQIRSWNKM